MKGESLIYDKLTDRHSLNRQPTDRQTDMRGHRSLLISILKKAQIHTDRQAKDTNRHNNSVKNVQIRRL